VTLCEITARQDPEEGFQDIALSIQSNTHDAASGSAVIRALGRHGSRLVGLNIAIGSEGVVFSSLGDVSHALVDVLARLYGVRVRAPRMRRSVGFVAHALQGDPAFLANEPVRLKLFPRVGWRCWEYCELYLAVDVARGEVEIREKDEDYREGVIAYLSRGPLGSLGLLFLFLRRLR
jgi:hypothetical protein